MYLAFKFLVVARRRRPAYQKDGANAATDSVPISPKYQLLFG